MEGGSNAMRTTGEEGKKSEGKEGGTVTRVSDEVET
jgi:hypothetical protein